MRMTIRLESHEVDALGTLARKEHRDPRNQVAFLLRWQLESQALLEADRCVRSRLAGAGEAMRPPTDLTSPRRKCTVEY